MLKSHFFSIIEQHNITEDACQRSVGSGPSVREIVFTVGLSY